MSLPCRADPASSVGLTLNADNELNWHTRVSSAAAMTQILIPPGFV